MQQVSSTRYFRIKCACALASTAALVFSSGLAPASAQTRPPDIKAEERQDPASGDVVIINRKKRKNSAPDPYAPAERKADGAKEKGESTTKAAAPKPLIRKQSGIARSAPAVKPPLPKRNTAPRNDTARLRQFPQNELGEPEPRARDVSPPRRAYRPPDDRRSYARRRSYPPPRYGYRSRRPWRQCRILARRCQAGFECSCYIWQRRCT